MAMTDRQRERLMIFRTFRDLVAERNRLTAELQDINARLDDLQVLARDHEAMIGSGAPSGEASRDERPAKDERKMFLSYCRDPQCCEVGRRMHLVPKG